MEEIVLGAFLYYLFNNLPYIEEVIYLLFVLKLAKDYKILSHHEISIAQENRLIINIVYC